MKVTMVRIYEIEVDDLDQFDRIAEDWDEDRIILDNHGHWDHQARQVEVLTSALDAGDLSILGGRTSHSILNITP